MSASTRDATDALTRRVKFALQVDCFYGDNKLRMQMNVSKELSNRNIPCLELDYGLHTASVSLLLRFMFTLITLSAEVRGQWNDAHLVP